METRKLTKEDIDKVRHIDGFPTAKDEDIIALSNAPYYTACPNPFIEDFIKEFGKPYNEEKDDFVWGEPSMATLYTKEDAEIVRKKLLEPRINKYQKTGKNYKEIHIGNLFEKKLRK